MTLDVLRTPRLERFVTSLHGTVQPLALEGEDEKTNQVSGALREE
jgi:hypothetical protein